VVEGIAESVVTATAHDDDPTFAAAARDRSRTSVGTESGRVAAGQKRSGLSQQGTDRDGPDAGKRTQDVEVAGSVVVVLLGELVEEAVEGVEAALALLVDHSEAWQQECDVCSSSLEGAWGEPHGGLLQHGEHFVRVQAADAVSLEELLDGTPLETNRLRAGDALDELPEPGLIRRRRELKEVRRTTVDLVPEAVGQAVHLVAHVLVDPGELADLDDQGVVGVDAPEAVPVVAQSVGQDVGIEPVILGPSHGVAVTEAVELLRIDGMDVKPSLEKRLHEGAPGTFDGHRDGLRRPSRFLDELVHEGRDVGGPVLNAHLAAAAAVGIEHADLM
jgi:hypothetical protein